LISGGAAMAWVLIAGGFGAFEVCRITREQSLNRLMAETAAAAQRIAQAPPDSELIDAALGALARQGSIRSVTLRDGARSRTLASDKAPVRDGWLDETFKANWTLSVQARARQPALLTVQADLKSETLGALDTYAALLWGLASIGVMAGGALYGVLVRRLERPIRALARDLSRMRDQRSVNARVDRATTADFECLLSEINAILDDREKSDTSLRAYKMDFERRVLERTRELDVALALAQDATRRAQDASRSKSEFLAKMSHEIRTPLNGVLGMADLLQHSASLDERQRRYAVVIHQSGTALMQLINDLLDFSKIEAGKLELAKVRFCIRDMVEDSLEIFAERAQSKNLELISDISDDLDTTVFADSLRLRQVILNLVGNAVKFTDRGDITVRVHCEPGIESSVFHFAVADTGIGIAAADQQDIFDAFVQADASPSRRYGGTGLGLAISRQLVTHMGGTLTVSSTEGVGSTFTMSVPLAVDRTAARPKSNSKLVATRALIIEKSATARRMLRQHLRSWGAQTTELESAVSALEKLRNAFSGEFDIIFLDACLPDKDAFVLVPAIRAIPEFAETPILIMHTGSNGPPPEAQDLKGTIGWQSKPIRGFQLRATMEQLLGLGADNVKLAAVTQGNPPILNQLGALRVLVVEDNSVNREVALATLLSLGVEAHTANNGQEALSLLARESFDAVLMDCQMPDLDGYETTKRFREWEAENARNRTPVIALTANALQGDEERCLAAGMDQYVGKPFTREELREALAFWPKAAERVVQQAEETGEVLDARTLSRIRELSNTGSRDLMSRLVSFYESNSRLLVGKLAVAVEAAEFKEVIRSAHALKSSSANVGALTLSRTSAALEAAARDAELGLAHRTLHRLLVEHEQVLRALHDHEATPEQVAERSAA
jgi:signal transduction histidine kinase/DNA-binding response OmpR family regulator